MAMGRQENEAVGKVFVMAGRGMDLQKAWERCGKPTTWGNVLRRYKHMKPPAIAAATAAPAAAPSKRARDSFSCASLCI